ncbi:hypothetical protein SYN63AY4M2_08515 [Synechococcus sp. 63AY4M2]|uniref:IS200/IS605 family accessory protein TnpB-related protein n=2 Tax=unclassified Synechococcus TaxID=2626047 RepID=UPI000C5AB687|nr:IS200/IS605 family accessory protein TnpB-related protein [Synechococcus sp. 63AY4M2]PIK87460.1 hypothetical protein SYN63AY4M2_08515 [Synechococcus sp. 63AY4M2]
MRDAIHKAARKVIDFCLHHSIGRIVFGWNKEQKQECGFNQNFVFIPTGRFKERIAQLCQHYGMEFIEVEEAYSSQASFLDGDELPNYGEKPDGWRPSGLRRMLPPTCLRKSAEPWGFAFRNCLEAL